MRKKRIRIISYLCAAFLVMGGFLLQKNGEARWYRRQVVNTYGYAFTEFANALSEMDASLQKCLYAGTPEMTAGICTEVYGKTTAATVAFSELPFSSAEFERTAGFIAKVGDYTYTLSKKAGGGEAISEEEYQNLAALSDTASVLAGNMLGLLSHINGGTITLDELSDLSRAAAQVGKEATAGVFEDSFRQVEAEFPDTPSLIYDGPFSGHIEDLKPKMLEGKNEVTKEDAAAIAARFFSIPRSTIKEDGERQGGLPVYLFTANVNGGVISFEITKQGGYVVSAFNSRGVTYEGISDEDAVAAAEAFLKDQGFRNMATSYHIKQEGAMTVNFAFMSEDIICYPDLVKVSVAMDNGSVTGFEAQGYVMNHFARDLPAVQVSPEAAEEKVSPHLTVQNHRLAIIPTDGKHEKFCHEFLCENGQAQQYIVYINAETGREERILVLLESENGTLTQ